MKRWIALVIVVILSSCKSKDTKVKNLIDNSSYGLSMSLKMKDIEKSKEEIYSIPIHYSMMKNYTSIVEGNEYVATRHIYKTDKGVYRVFYIIDVSEEKIIEKTSDYNVFYLPLMVDVFKDSDFDFIGDNKMDLWRYMK